MSGPRRSRLSPNASSSRRNNSRDHTSTSTSTKDEEERQVVHNHHHHRRFKRPFASSPSLGSRPGWVILSQHSAPQDRINSDRTSSVSSLTSNGDEICVSFELVEPPGISVLILDWLKVSGPSASARLEIIAVHRDVILFKMYSGRSGALVDYFVYKASRDDASRWPASLLLLPTTTPYDDDDDEGTSFAGRRGRHLFMSRDDTGIMSWRIKGESSFVVAKLTITFGSRPEIKAYIFLSGCDDWKVFKNLQVNGANGGGDLQYWFTDAVVPYQHRFLMWVDYYQGMILADMSSQSEGKDEAPRLWYVPFPVDRVTDKPDHSDYGRGFPQGSRCVCATRDGLKFVTVDRRHTSNWGVGHHDVMKWNHTFRITTWSLREHDNTWTRDVTMYEEEFLGTVGSGDHVFPRVAPEYPVVNMDNPDVVCFRLKKNSYSSGEQTWMIEVDMKKKVLLAATSYSMERSSCGELGTINYARVTSDALPFSSDLPRYLDDGRDCKKRRQ